MDESRSPGASLRDAASEPAPDLRVTLAGITFPTPILSAPGPLEFGRQVQGVYDLRAFGGFITKSITLEPREGHPGPHTVATASGWLNAVGLRNPGAAGFIAREMPFLRTLGRPIIVSIAGHRAGEFAAVADMVSGEPGVSGLELNVSCPNVEDGLVFGTDPGRTGALAAAGGGRARARARRRCGPAPGCRCSSSSRPT